MAPTDDPEVVCAGCARPLPRSKADIVDSGTGHRCDRCSGYQQVWSHVGAAIDEERYRERHDLEPSPGPPMANVIAQVNAAQADRWGTPAASAPFTADELPPRP